jgi:hypothetical protein
MCVYVDTPLKIAIKEVKSQSTENLLKSITRDKPKWEISIQTRHDSRPLATVGAKNGTSRIIRKK